MGLKARLPRPVASVLRAARAVLIVVVVLGVLVRFTTLVDRFFIFFPEGDLDRTPADRGLEFDDVFFQASDEERLHGWFVPGTTDKTIVWFHGNAGNIGHRVDNIVELHDRLGVNIFIFDYRGYGLSDGSPSEQGMYLDADAALSYVAARSDVREGDLVYFGRSLGCAVAAEAARRSPPNALVLESGFTSVQEMASLHYPVIGVFGRLMQTKFDCRAKLKAVNVPVLVMHGDRDDIVPIDIGRKLFDAANPPKRFYTISGAGHNDTYVAGGEEYYDELARFLDDPTGGKTIE